MSLKQNTSKELSTKKIGEISKLSFKELLNEFSKDIENDGIETIDSVDVLEFDFQLISQLFDNRVSCVYSNDFRKSVTFYQTPLSNFCHELLQLPPENILV